MLVGFGEQHQFEIFVIRALGCRDRHHQAGAAIENKFGFITFIVALGGVVLFGRWLQEKSAVPAPVAAGALPPSTPAETA